MNGRRPFLLVRARPREEARVRFLEWFHRVHLRDVLRIPGFVEIQHGVTPGGTVLGFYTFESTDAVQSTLASPEAAYARGTWEQWAGSLDELGIELYAPLMPLPLYHDFN